MTLLGQISLDPELSVLMVNNSLLEYMTAILLFILIDIPSYIISRGKLVNELIARVNHYHIVQVNGTPASGKTVLMNLVANTLLERYGQATPIHSVTGWDKEISKSGWAAHLQQVTGVHGRSWIGYSAYLLLDEAQQSFWDHELWTDFFKRIEPGTSPFIILFMSYGSPNRGFPGFNKEEHVQTPMVFATEQQISLQPEKCIETHSLRLLPWKPVGLLLDEDEAIEVVGRYTSVIIRSSIALTPDLKRGFFACSNGHVGLLTSLIRVLQDVPVSLSLKSRYNTNEFINVHIPNRRFMSSCGMISRSVGPQQAVFFSVNP